MKLLYVGMSVYAEYAFKAAAKELGYEFRAFPFEEEIPALRSVSDKLIAENAEVYVIDISIFSEDSDEMVATQLERLKTAVNADVIIHAPLYNRESKILLNLQAMGFTKVITQLENQGRLKASLMEAVNQSAIEQTQQEELIQKREASIAAIEKELPQIAAYVRQKEHEETAREGTITKIAVIGAKEYIGTTTVCLQLVKYLNSEREASAAYIELNKSRYIRNLQEYFDPQRMDDSLSSICMNGVAMFSDPRKMPEILSEGYCWYIYDYGSIGFVNDLSSIYEKDLIILVGGMKANEVIQTTEAMKELFGQRNMFYIMNFVPQSSRKKVLDLMEGAAEKTYFLESCFDPFVYNIENGKIFDAILKSDYKPVVSKKNRKLGRLFR